MQTCRHIDRALAAALVCLTASPALAQIDMTPKKGENETPLRSIDLVIGVNGFKDAAKICEAWKDHFLVGKGPWGGGFAERVKCEQNKSPKLQAKPQRWVLRLTQKDGKQDMALCRPVKKDSKIISRCESKYNFKYGARGDLLFSSPETSRQLAALLLASTPVVGVKQKDESESFPRKDEKLPEFPSKTLPATLALNANWLYFRANEFVPDEDPWPEQETIWIVNPERDEVSKEFISALRKKVAETAKGIIKAEKAKQAADKPSDNPDDPNAITSEGPGADPEADKNLVWPHWEAFGGASYFPSPWVSILPQNFGYFFEGRYRPLSWFHVSAKFSRLSALISPKVSLTADSGSGDTPEIQGKSAATAVRFGAGFDLPSETFHLFVNLSYGMQWQSQEWDYDPTVLEADAPNALDVSIKNVIGLTLGSEAQLGLLGLDTSLGYHQSFGGLPTLRSYRAEFRLRIPFPKFMLVMGMTSADFALMTGLWLETVTSQTSADVSGQDSWILALPLVVTGGGVVLRW